MRCGVVFPSQYFGWWGYMGPRRCPTSCIESIFQGAAGSKPFVYLRRTRPLVLSARGSVGRALELQSQSFRRQKRTPPTTFQSQYGGLVIILNRHVDADNRQATLECPSARTFPKSLVAQGRITDMLGFKFPAFDCLVSIPYICP
jgi:hypothetical protein